MNAAPAADDRLPQSLLDAIADRGPVHVFPANSILINEGDRGDSLYIVLAGRVKTYTSDEQGREMILSEQGPGEYLGELALDRERRSASVKTLEPTTCRIVAGVELRQFMTEYPEFALHVTRKLIRMVRRLTEQVKSLALQDVYGRVVRLLDELSQPHGEQRIVRHPLTQQDIAQRVGASREMVNRIMKELTVGGYVSVQADRRIVIHKQPPAAW